jgi:hypothetical protein
VWSAIAISFELRELGLFGRPLHPWNATIGLLYVAIGLALAGGRLFYDAAQRRRTWYGITSRRCIVLRGAARSAQLVPFHRIRAIKLQSHADGSGTVLLDTGEAPDCDNPRDVREWGRPLDPCFDRIDDAPKVYELIQARLTRSPLSVEARAADPAPPPAETEVNIEQ